MCVADAWNDRASVFRVDDGGFVKHLASKVCRPLDVEEVQGGWLVVSRDSHSLEFVGDGAGGAGGGRPPLGKVGGGSGSGDGELKWPAALAVVPGLGLVVREFGNERLQVFG
jgi:hypothetical protein